MNRGDRDELERMSSPRAAFEWLDRAFTRLHELCDEFGIDRPQGNDSTGWMMLALMLAMEREPELRPFRSSGGRPSSGGLTKDVILCVELAKAETEGKSVREAAHHLAGTKHFEADKPDSIRVRYYKLKNPKSERDRLDRERLLRFLHGRKEKAVD